MIKMFKKVLMWLMLREIEEAEEEVNLNPLGYISEKYESGGGYTSASTIADNAGDPGGKSYGVYQLAINTGTLKRYIDWSKYSIWFQGIEMGSEQFDKQWKALAAQEPEKFASDQRIFIRRTHYGPAHGFAQSQGFPPNSRAIQEAIFSISVQHAGYKRIIRAARRIKTGKSIPELVNALYDARESYVSGLNSLPKAVKAAVLSRYVDERKDVLELADVEVV